MPLLPTRLPLLFVVPAVAAGAFAGTWLGATQKAQLRVVPTRSHTLRSQSPLPTSLPSSESFNNITPTDPKRRHRVQLLVEDFVQHVQGSLNEGTFVALTLRGVKKPKDPNPAQSVRRGSIRQVRGRLIRVHDQNMLQLTYKYHLATDICKNTPIDAVTGELSRLLLLMDDDADTITSTAAVTSEWGAEALQSQPLRGGDLLTNSGTLWELSLVPSSKPSLRQKTVRHHPLLVNNNNNNKSVTPTGPSSHDRVKQVPLSKEAEFLQRLGVTKPDGRPRKGMASKLRQCQKFVEVVGGLIQRANAEAGDDPHRPIQVLDMGCGRGYLTFSLHSFLCSEYPTASVLTKGIDIRPKLVAEIVGIARDLGSAFATLDFQEGTIEEVVAEASHCMQEKVDTSLSLDVLVALHACDTATDDAIYAGIARGANVIVVAPCCHKQVRPQVDAHYASTRQSHPLSEILCHGVYRERHSETVTDSIRALLLELAGYKVQVFEFIGGEHTSKNVMIAAVKMNRPIKDEKSIQEQIASSASFHGIRRHKLAEWMDVRLAGVAETGDSDPTPSTIKSHIRMPPLRPRSGEKRV